MKKTIWKEVIRVAITILTSIATCFGMGSCTIESGNRYIPRENGNNISREVILKDRVRSNIKNDSLVITNNNNIYE